MNTLTLDIETNGLNSKKNVITCICAKASNGGEFRFSNKKEKEILLHFYNWILSYSKEKYMLVAHNGIRFDIPFIIERSKQNSLDNKILLFQKYKIYDTMNIISKWMKLDELADLYSLPKKTGNGTHAIELFNENKFDELMVYCWDDVVLTERVFNTYQKLKEDNLFLFEKN